MRIAIVGINYAPEEIGIGRYSTDMATGLAARGHTVSMIAGQPYYPQWSVFPGYKGRGWTTRTERGVSVTRCPHYVPSSPNGLRRVLHLLSFTASALRPALALALAPRDRRPQVVMCIAPSLLSVPVAWLAARLSGARLWLHVQDFEVEAAAATG
jgi:colanic acid biosynthesis glycosyl transferase WcaI